MEGSRIAQQSSDARKMLLKDYRMQVVWPIPLEYDWQTGAESKGKLLPSSSVSRILARLVLPAGR